MKAMAHRRWKNATAEERRLQGKRGQAGLVAKFEREIDPEGTLPADERAKRVENARSEHFADLGFQKARLERRRYEQQLKTQSNAKRKVAGSSVAAGEPAGETAITQSARTGQEPR